MDKDLLPPDLNQAAWSAAFIMFWAWVGRMTWHVRQVQKRHRRFWSMHLVWEMPTALAIGFVADGICAYFNLTGHTATAVIVMVSYLGPSGIESIILRLIDRNSIRGEP